MSYFLSTVATFPLLWREMSYSLFIRTEKLLPKRGLLKDESAEGTGQHIFNMDPTANWSEKYGMSMERYIATAMNPLCDTTLMTALCTWNSGLVTDKNIALAYPPSLFTMKTEMFVKRHGINMIKSIVRNSLQL